MNRKRRKNQPTNKPKHKPMGHAGRRNDVLSMIIVVVVGVGAICLCYNLLGHQSRSRSFIRMNVRYTHINVDMAKTFS